MRPPIREASGASGALSREQVRQQFLDVCVPGDEPPDIEALVSLFAEPMRSELRSELESLQREYANPTRDDRGAETRDSDSAGTLDHVPELGRTIDSCGPSGRHRR
jgi:hypothetical protein